MILYQKNEDGFEICLKKTDEDPNKSDWFILREDDVTDIEQNVRNGNYCAIIGPPRSQKSHILKAVNEKIKNKDDTVCILLDMKSISFEVFEQFLYNFANLFKRELKSHAEIATSLSPEDVIDTHSLQKFVSKYIELMKKKLVLLIDHIEKIHMKPRQLLFEAFNEIKSEGNKSLAIAIASSLSALEPNYSFQADHNTFMKDLSTQASAKLIDCIFEQRGIRITPDSRQCLVEHTAGDRHLISVLCEDSADKANENGVPKTVDKVGADNAIKWFLDEEAYQYEPLKKAINPSSCSKKLSCMISIR